MAASAASVRRAAGKHAIERRLAEVGVDKQDATLIRLGKCQREVCGGQRFALASHCAGDHHGLDAAQRLGVVERRRELAVLFA